MKKIIFFFALLVTKLLSLNLQFTKSIRKEITKDNTLPIIRKKKKTIHQDVKPVRHKKLIPENIRCPECKATALYIYCNGNVYSKTKKKVVQRYKCKRCNRQWIYPAREYQKQLFSAFCPFCKKRLDLKKHRIDFDVYKCINPHCDYKKKHNTRYTIRLPRADFKEENLSFYRSRFHPQIITITLFLYSFSISSREVTLLLKSLFNIDMSHQTVLNLFYSFATLLKEKNLPIRNSNLWIVDEKYVPYEGKWGYLFSVLNSDGSLISYYFSRSRSVIGAYRAIYSACQKTKPKILTLVSDKYCVYPLVKEMISAEFNIKIDHIRIKGLCSKDDTPKEREYRKYKNLIENYHSIIESLISKKRGFGSYKGAVAFFTLFYFWYNYVKPNSRFGNRPPIPIASDILSAWAILLNK